MLTILILLGSGFAFSVGAVLGAWAAGARSDKFAKRDEAATAALLERNEIGHRQVIALNRLADAAEACNK